MARKPRSTAAALKLPPVLDLNAAAPLRAEFLGVKGRAVTVDAAEVDRVGALCVQVLLAARAQWARDGVAFAITDASDSFSAGLATLGATSLLASPN